MADIKLTEWLNNYKSGKYDCDSLNERDATRRMCEAGWYDWFCSDRHLVTAFKEFAPKIVGLCGSKKINTETMYVWFKNNCPMLGPTYDDFRISDLETGEVLYTIEKMRRGCNGDDFSGWAVWGVENDFSNPLAKGSWRDVRKFFMAEA